MQELKAEMYRAMMNEYKRAEKEHGGTFHSTHEAYAVTKEEVEEATTDAWELLDWMDKVWTCTKKDLNPALVYKSMQDAALEAAAECIQVAAMCRKALLSECCVEERSAREEIITALRCTLTQDEKRGCKKFHRDGCCGFCLNEYMKAAAAMLEADALQPKTNADSIREMNDNELAKFMFEVNDMCPPGESWDECPKDYNAMLTCIECWSKWLRLPAEGGPND